MRTVSFSNYNVRNLLNRNFVCTFKNLEGDPTAGESIGHSPNEPAGNCIRGNGNQNVQTIFLTPDGDIFHVATGFLSAADLADEAKFALEIFREFQRDPESPSDLIVSAHRDRLADLGFSKDQVESTNPMMAMMDLMKNGGGGAGTLRPRGQAFGSGNRNGGGNVFEGFIKKQILEDNQFSMKNPLMRIEDLERDPTQLVGNGKSFFSSSSSGNNR